MERGEMKIGTIIAYSGAHGTGKTTDVYERIALLKRENPGLLIGPHAENIVFCPYPINDQSTPESQMWILTNHIQAELYLMTRYDIVVSDRSAVDAVAYTAAYGFTDLAENMLSIVRHHMPHYSEIIIKTIESNYLFNDGLRDLDREFRLDVQKQLLLAYSGLGYFLEKNGSIYTVRRGES